jgi:hypothetical protein
VVQPTISVKIEPQEGIPAEKAKKYFRIEKPISTAELKLVDLREKAEQARKKLETVTHTKGMTGTKVALTTGPASQEGSPQEQKQIQQITQQAQKAQEEVQEQEKKIRSMQEQQSRSYIPQANRPAKRVMQRVQTIPGVQTTKIQGR